MSLSRSYCPKATIASTSPTAMRMIALLASLMLVAGCKQGRQAEGDSCGRALLQMMDKAEQEPDRYDYLPDYVAGCGALYQKEPCQKAWQQAAKEKRSGPTLGLVAGDERYAALAKACADAYCPDLGDKAKAYCSIDKWDTQSLSFKWPLLHRAILEHEISDQPALLAALRIPFAPIAISSALPMNLPRAAGSGAVQMVLGIEVRADGSYAVDGKKINERAELLTLGKKARADNPDVRAVIRADKHASHGDVIRVLDIIKQAGINKIAFGTQPMAEPPSQLPAPPQDPSPNSSSRLRDHGF